MKTSNYSSEYGYKVNIQKKKFFHGDFPYCYLQILLMQVMEIYP